MQNENISQFLEQLKNHWQLLAFGVFLVGYITFAFYMQINGFSFIIPDLKFLVAFGLIVSLLCVPIIFLSRIENLHWRVVFIPLAYTPILFLNEPIYAVIAIFTAVLLLHFYFKKNTINTNNKTNSRINLIYSVLLICVCLIFEWQLAALFIINVFFFLAFQTYYKKQKTYNSYFLFSYVFITSYLVASLININGLIIANMAQTNISLKLENNTSINGILIFDDTQYLYIRDQNTSKSIMKSKIQDTIIYERRTMKSKNIMELLKEVINKVASFLKFKNFSPMPSASNQPDQCHK